MTNRQCSLTKSAQNPDDAAFEMVIAEIPQEIPADKVLLKVLVSGHMIRFSRALSQVSCRPRCGILAAWRRCAFSDAIMV